MRVCVYVCAEVRVQVLFVGLKILLIRIRIHVRIHVHPIHSLPHLNHPFFFFGWSGDLGLCSCCASR